MIWDQRGFSVRQFAGTADIGAFERFTLSADDFVVTSTDATLVLANDTVTLPDAIYASSLTEGPQTIDVVGAGGTIRIDLEQLQIIDGYGFELSDMADWRISDLLFQDGQLLLTADNSFGGNTGEIEVAVPSPWHNFLRPGDVNNDGAVRASDALWIINELAWRSYSNESTAQLAAPALESWPGIYFDQNGDGMATALDALRIINELAVSSAIEGEPTALAAGPAGRTVQIRSDKTYTPAQNLGVQALAARAHPLVGSFHYGPPNARTDEFGQIDSLGDATSAANDELFANQGLLDDLLDIA